MSKYHASIEVDTFALIATLEQTEGIRVIDVSLVTADGLHIDLGPKLVSSKAPIVAQADLPNIPPAAELRIHRSHQTAQTRLDRVQGRVRKAKPVTRRSKVTLHDDTVLAKSRRGHVRDLPPQPKQAWNVWRARNRVYPDVPITVKKLHGLVSRKHPHIKAVQSVISNLVHRHGVLRAMPK